MWYSIIHFDTITSQQYIVTNILFVYKQRHCMSDIGETRNKRWNWIESLLSFRQDDVCFKQYFYDTGLAFQQPNMLVDSLIRINCMLKGF